MGVYIMPHIIIVNQRPSINKGTSKYRREKQKWQGGMPLFVLEITPGSQMIS